MQFKMDAQCFEDLNIFSKDKATYSIFGLFKNVKTLGARERLEEMMRNPIADIQLLTARKDSIRFFCENKVELKISHDQMDLITHYLKHDSRYLRNNIADALVAHFQNKLTSNVNYYIVQIGLKHLIDLLVHAAELAEELSKVNVPDNLKKLGKALQQIIETDHMKYAISLQGKRKLKFYQLSKLDSLIRGKNKLVVIDLLHLMYELDVFENLANVTLSQGFCLPSYVDDNEVSIHIEGMFHPGITGAVPNDIELDRNNNLVFLSGSNMAGKSSLLRSLGLSVYLSHIGFPVPAKQVRTGIFNGLVTSINLSDNTRSGLSHYYSEVMRIKQTALMLLESNRMFIILDELFKGTNAQDAHDASLLVITELAKVRNSAFIISTHMVELAGQLEKIGNISFKYMETILINEKPKFTYLLQNGISNDRIGMYIIHNEGLADLLRKASLNNG